MKGYFQFYLGAILGAIILMADAFYNGFPIVYSDTSTYIASGFEFQTPFDRPITYGLFVWAASLFGTSLWFVIFFQSFILSCLIFLLVKLVIGEKKYLFTSLLIILFISLFTGVSWVASQLMPDIFTSIALLGIVLIFLGNYSKPFTVILYIIYFIAVAMHMSHLVLFFAVIICAFFIQKFIFNNVFSAKGVYIKSFVLLALTGASIFTMGSAMSKSKHVFFMGAMVEHGILQEYLNDHCAEKQYQLCAYKDSLNMKAYEFVWDERSPFYKIGGWKDSKKEIDDIAHGTLTQPKYIGMHIGASCKATFQQLSLFSIGDGNGSFGKETLLYQRIEKYFQNDIAAYRQARQYHSQLKFIDIVNPIYSIIMIVCLLTLITLLVVYRRRWSAETICIISIVLIGVFFNAWSCGTFANAIDRLGCKMAWLLPLAMLLFIFSILKMKGKFVVA